MIIDADDPQTKQLESFCQTSLGSVVQHLAQKGIQVENVEYLKGETHYIAVSTRAPSHALELGISLYAVPLRTRCAASMGGGRSRLPLILFVVLPLKACTATCMSSSRAIPTEAGGARAWMSQR